MGEHPLASITRIIIDFETAYSDDYRIETRSDLQGKWVTATIAEKLSKKVGSKHILHTLTFNGGADDVIEGGFECDRYMRLYVERGATAWGTSVWEIQVWATPLADERCA